jgi:hypothetical protein
LNYVELILEKARKRKQEISEGETTEQKIKRLELENKRLKNQNQFLLNQLEEIKTCSNCKKVELADIMKKG